jgi:hypothetical protein
VPRHGPAHPAQPLHDDHERHGGRCRARRSGEREHEQLHLRQDRHGDRGCDGDHGRLSIRGAEAQRTTIEAWIMGGAKP